MEGGVSEGAALTGSENAFGTLWANHGCECGLLDGGGGSRMRGGECEPEPVGRIGGGIVDAGSNGVFVGRRRDWF